MIYISQNQNLFNLPLAIDCFLFATTAGSTNTQPTSNSTTDGTGTADNTGGVVAGVMVALIVGIIAVVVVVIVIVIVLRKRQGKTLFYSVTKTGTFGANSKQVGGFGKLIHAWAQHSVKVWVSRY